jgi:hypothetical protein
MWLSCQFIIFNRELGMPRTPHPKPRNLTPQRPKPPKHHILLRQRRLPRTLKPFRRLNMTTQIPPRHRPSIRSSKQHIANPDPLTRRRARALHTSHNISLQRPAHRLNREITDLKLRSIALSGEARVGVALGNVKGLQGVLRHGVAEGDVAEVAQAGAAAVGRRALDYAGPGLDVDEVFVVVGGDVADDDV